VVHFKVYPTIMVIDDVVKTPAVWMSMRGAGIVISSRVRLARNVKGAAFPDWAGDDECARLCESMKQVIGGVGALKSPLFVDMDKLGEVDKLVLGERSLISQELAEKGRGSALVIDAEVPVAVMINEEDHLRIQSIRPGMHLKEVWENVNAIDSELEKVVDFAFSRRIGYLTACPSNVGTGLRASVMMHLSGLKLTDEVDAVLNGLNKLGLAVRGLFGEGTESYGNMFQISNQSTLGESEEVIVDHLVEVVHEVTEHEQNARMRLMEQKRIYVVDHVARAFALLRHALVLSSGEAMDFLSALRLGVEVGIVHHLTVAKINQLMLLVQPGHLQKLAGKILAPGERDELRAGMIKKKVKNVLLTKELGIGKS